MKILLLTYEVSREEQSRLLRRSENDEREQEGATGFGFYYI